MDEVKQPSAGSPLLAANLLAQEHRALLAQYGHAQLRCSAVICQQAEEIAQLQALVMQLRAEVIKGDTALAYAREALATLKADTPGLSQRVKLVRRIEALREHVRELMRERLHWQWRSATKRPLLTTQMPPVETQSSVDEVNSDDLQALDASLVAADLVICQTGCLSHGAYWRVKDHCKRTGKTCVLVSQPEALRIVRIHHLSQGVAAEE